MLEKIITTEGWDYEVSAVPVTSGTSQELIKQAGMDISDVEPQEGRSLILIMALGGGEIWGPNRNGDYFSRDELKKTHKTFETFAKYYKNHVNKPTSPSYGEVLRSFYNETMDRVELLVSVDLKKYPDFLKKVEEQESKGKMLAFSMAAKVPYDVCCICGHRRTKVADQCIHVKTQLGKVLDDGRQVFVYNYNPKFFDISEVYIPADKTAFMLKKVASAAPYTPELEKQASLKDLTKYAYIQKLSELEKRVQGFLAGKVKDKELEIIKDGVTPVSIPDEVLARLSETSSKNRLFKALADKGIILRPREFFKVINPEREPSDNLLGSCQSIFSKLLSHPDVVSRNYSDFDFRDSGSLIRGVLGLKKFVAPRSLKDDVLTTRIIIVRSDPNLSSLKSDFCLRCRGIGPIVKLAFLEQGLDLAYGLYKYSALKYIVNNDYEPESFEKSQTVIASVMENYL